MRKRFLVHPTKFFDRCIGIGGRLEVRQKVFALAIPQPHPLDALIDLAKNTRAWQPPAGTETTVVAKRAAARRDRTVHIGAGKSGIDAHLLHPSPKTLPEEEVTRVVRQSGISPGQPSFARRKSFG